MATLLPCCYLAPVSHYSAYYRADEVRLEVNDYFVKQTLRNRCLIDSPSGVLPLSIPVCKAEGKTLMRDVRISDHGNWRHRHWVALESSYRQSPFFEYYADDFAPFYEKKWEFLADFNEELMALVASLLDISKPVRRTATYEGAGSKEQGAGEYRLAVQSSCSLASCSQLPAPRPYYQVFASRHGFLPDLSIVDLLFNEGPEGVLWL